MKIALAQLASPTEEPVTERRARVRELLRTDLPRDVDLVVLPELWAVGFCHYDDYDAEAETLEGPTVALAREIAHELHTWVHAGSIVERGADGALRNTTVLVNPDGEPALRTSKVHVFGYASREVDLLTPGRYIATCPTPFGTASSTTCYDLRFPGLWNELVDAGAEIVIVPAAWPTARREHWRLLTSARAVDTQTLLIACNAAGEQAGVRQAGHSRVVDPWGTVLAEAGADEQLLLVDADPGVVRATRKEFAVLADRLPDYRTLTRQVGIEPWR